MKAPILGHSFTAVKILYVMLVFTVLRLCQITIIVRLEAEHPGVTPHTPNTLLFIAMPSHKFSLRTEMKDTTIVSKNTTFLA